MSKITKLARERACMVRLPGCDGGGATTVAAHYRSVSLGSGTGIKPHDLLSAWACDRCHSQIDGRVKPAVGYDYNDIRLAHAEGCLRTIAELIKLGAIK